MIELLTAFATKQAVIYAGGSFGAFVLTWVLKKIPNDSIKKVVGKFMYGLGVTVTLGLSKWKVTAKFWNKIIEPFFIDLIDNIVGHGIQEFIRGLRSDNT